MGKKKHQANNPQGRPTPQHARTPDATAPTVGRAGPSHTNQHPPDPNPDLTQTQATSQRTMLTVASLVAAWLLLLLPHAAYHLLSPQTGEWLAGLSSGVLLAGGVGAAAVGAASVRAWQTLGLPGAPGGAGAVPAALWVAAASTLACKRLAQALGGLLLSPGLSLDDSLRLTSVWLVVRTLLIASLAFGPALTCLGFAAGQCGAQLLLPQRPGAQRLLLLGLSLAAAWAGWRGMPGVPPKPGTIIPALVAMAAAVLAAGLAAVAPAEESSGGSTGTAGTAGASKGRGKGQGSSNGGEVNAATATRPGTLHWAAAALVAAIAVGQAARNFPTRQYASPGRAVADGQYSLLYASEAWLGGYVSVFEGILAEKYRYRLLRVDHSIVGGEYVAPPEVAGQSVYTAFYLQQAILAARSINASAAPGGKPRSLHIGLGVGTTVKGLQQAGTVADVLELHQEIVDAATAYFGVRPSGHTLVGDAAATLRTLPDGAYDYIIHDVFSGGAAPPLMREAFFRQLRSKLAPGGVAAVNFVGSRGQPLKELWCRLRLAFPHVRAFADQEKSAVKNYVLFASDGPLGGMESRAAALLADEAIQGAWDPPALDVLRTLGQSEVKFTFDRQRCVDLLGLGDEEAEGGGGNGKKGKRRGKQSPLWGPGTNLPPEARSFAAEMEAAMGSALGQGEPGSNGVQGEVQGGSEESAAQHAQRIMAKVMLQRQQQQAAMGGGRHGQKQLLRKKWAIERWRAETAAGQAAAAYHWVVMRQQLDDELWRSY